MKNSNKITKIVTIGTISVSLVFILSGCDLNKQTNNSNNNDSMSFNIKNTNSILLTVGNNTYSLKITDFTRLSKGWIDLTLADGTKISTNDKNVIAYNDNSPLLQEVKDEVININNNNNLGIDNLVNNDMMLLLLNEQIYKIPIKDFNRISKGWIDITLKDDSKLSTNAKNVIIYNQDSPLLQEIENDVISIDNIPSESSKNNDTMLLLLNDQIYKVPINDFTRISNGWIDLILDDGSKISTNETNIITYNDNSKIMDQVEEHSHVKTLKMNN